MLYTTRIQIQAQMHTHTHKRTHKCTQQATMVKTLRLQHNAPFSVHHSDIAIYTTHRTHRTHRTPRRAGERFGEWWVQFPGGVPEVRMPVGLGGVFSLQYVDNAGWAAREHRYQAIRYIYVYV
jgi:hypothetical protein